MDQRSERTDAESRPAADQDRQGLQIPNLRSLILGIVTSSAVQYMKTADLGQSIDKLLARLGQATGADRAYVFENKTDSVGTLLTRQRHVWTAPDIKPAAEDTELWNVLLLDVGLQRWVDTLGSGQILCGHVRELPSNESKLLATQNIQSILLVPIVVQGNWWGFVGFDHCRAEREWSPPEIQAVRAAANVIGAAWENAQLHQDTFDRAHQLSVLQDLGRTIGSTLDEDEVLRLTLQRVCSLLHAARATAYLADMANNVALRHAAAGLAPTDVASTRRLPLKNSLTGQVIITGRPVYIDEDLWTDRDRLVTNDSGSLIDNALSELPTSTTAGKRSATTAKAAAFVPLLVGEHVLGTLNLAFDRPHTFSDNEKQLLAAVGRQTGIALANARLFQEIVASGKEARRRAEQLAALHRIDQAINSSLEPAAVYACIVEQAADLLDCHVGTLFLWSAALDEPVGVANFSSGSAESPITDAVGQRCLEDQTDMIREIREKRVPLVITDAEHDTRVSPQLREQHNTRALLALPLISRDKIIGFLTLIDQTGPRQWRQDEITIAGQLADQAAIAIENARLFETEHKTRQTAEALQESAHIVNASLVLDRALQLLLEQLAKLVQFDSAAVFLRAGQRLKVAAGHGFPDLQAVMQLSVDTADNALLAQITDRRCPLVLADARKDERFQAWGGTGYVRGWMGVPLMVGSELVGVLTIDSRRPEAYDEQSARLAQALADQAAVAIHKTRLLDDLQRAYRELREVEKLKDQFIQNVAHELRTPLTLVRGYVELLAQGDLSPENQQKAIRTAMGHTDTLVQMVEAITTLQDLTLGELTLQPVNPSAVVAAALQSARQKAARAGISLIADPSPDPPPFSGDFFRLSQALIQLLDNAIKFSPDGGTITVFLRDDIDAHELEIAVEDQGIGVPSDEQQRIFGSFYQADGTTTRRFAGTGLGLAIVQHTVEAHGGRVWVESPVQKDEDSAHPGSRFVIRLPRTN